MKKKMTVLLSGVLVIILMVVGITFAIFMFNQEGVNNQQLVLGDIWMKYTETNGINLSGALPGDDYSQYFEFTITGTNTYQKKDIWYDVVLTDGDKPSDKEEDNRIPDKYLKFKLVEVNSDNSETEIFKDKTYDDLTNRRIHVATISKSTTNYNKKYRIYMTISENLTIGNTGNEIMTMEKFENVFASVKVNVTGDFNEKEVPLTAGETLQKSIAAKAVSSPSCKTTVVEDGITYISGTKDCIDFNYVWYSGKLWRITAIYPDGSMKMITDSMITSIAYGADNKFKTDDDNTSYVYQWLNEDFLDTLYNYQNIIIKDAVWNASPGNETITTKLPVEGQEEILVNASVGLLNSYEYSKSYQNTSDSNGYLNIGYYWWLLNPYSASTSNVWNVDSLGRGNDDSPSGANGGRPVVNLKSTIQLIGGTGTESDPYRIKGDKEEAIANTTLLNKRSSGEYVNFDDGLYRIVGVENETTKLIKADYIKDGTTILTKKFASSSTFGSSIETGSDDYWDYYLNNTWKSSIEDTYESMLTEGTYYTKSFTGGNYKGTACPTVSNTTSIKDCDKTGVSTWSGYVGLPRYGEMFSSQTRDYTSSNAEYMWLITPYNSSNVWFLSYNGYGLYFSPSYTYGGRPTIHLKNTVVIKSGEGTKEKPFEVGFAS